MATHPKTFLTPEQYLEIEPKAEFKSEYYQGEMFLMGGAREAHNLIVFNLAGVIGVQLRKRPCRAYVNDMRVCLNATAVYTYPDLTALCQPDGRWLLTTASRMEDSLDLQSVGGHLALADLYEKVDFPAPVVASPAS